MMYVYGYRLFRCLEGCTDTNGEICSACGACERRCYGRTSGNLFPAALSVYEHMVWSIP